MLYTNSNKVVIILYKPFACGKFLSNILSYSDNCFPMTNPYIWYNNKEKFPITTLPEDPINWAQNEPYAENFWGFDINSPFNKNISLSNILEKTKKILEDNNWYCFITSHYVTPVFEFKKIFKNAQIIQIINDDLIRKKSLKIKSRLSEEKIKIDIDWEILDPAIKFDISSLFNKEEFFNNVNMLMKDLNINQPLDSSVVDYYNNYIQYYKSK